MTDHTTGGQVIRLPQDQETPLTSLSVPFGTALYLYSRSVDSINAGTVGQDYLAFRFDGSRAVFAVCDGVGQSFMGDLAARLLGDGLIRWLWGTRRPADEAAFAHDVSVALNEMTGQTARAVAAYELPASLPPILKQALEMQRAYGSESMFVAGRIEMTQPDPWVALCWLGDSPVAAVDIDGKLVDLSPKGQTSERWNATTGVKGQVHAWVSGARSIARVAGYTDGLGISGAPVDDDLRALMEQWIDSPPIDDASLFDLRLAPSPQTTGRAGPLMLPAGDEVKSAAEDTRPIVVPDSLKGAAGPVSSVARIEPQPDQSAVEGWRPLTPKTEPPAEPAPEVPSAADALAALSLPKDVDMEDLGRLEKIGELADLSHSQQVRMWQRAAMLGLTSAALALLMVERLVSEQEKKERRDE
ncbi:MAG: hypothetical protein Kow00124_14700 [Anaerolineae bacterium]